MLLFFWQKLFLQNNEYDGDFIPFLIDDIKSDEDIKLYLNASLKDYLDDGNFNSFYAALEIAIKAKEIVIKATI